jgi:serine/threonine-protein kinase
MAAHVVDAQAIGAGGSTPGGLTPPRALPSIEGYEVRQQIGETAASDVYLAAHTASGVLRTIAVQRSENDPAATRRIVREVLEASRVKHPGVALVDGVGTTRDNRLYVATAYLPGTTLAELLESEGHLPARRVVQIAFRAAEALEAAHKLGVIHGDLTPENIIVGPAGPDGVEPVGVTGFGMTTARTGSASPVEPPKQARPYASPERLSGGYLDARSDVFSLASIVLHALSGNAPPPPRASTGRGVTPSASVAIQPNARLAPAQVLLVARAAEPERRYASAAIFRETLAAGFGEGDESRRTPDAAHAIATVSSVAVPARRPTPPAAPVAPTTNGTTNGTTPARVTPINPFLRPTPAKATPAIAATAVPATPVLEPPRPARWDLPAAEMQAPSGLVIEPLGMVSSSSESLAFGPPPVRDEAPSAPAAPSSYSPSSYSPPSYSSYSPTPTASFEGAALVPTPASSPAYELAPSSRSVIPFPMSWTPARRRGAMIGGAVAASVLLGAWAMMSRPPEPPGSAATPGATAAAPAAKSPALGALSAAVARFTDSAVSDAAKATPVATATQSADDESKGSGSVARSERSGEGAGETSEVAPVPKVVLPDVAMSGDLNPSTARLSQSALSEASVSTTAPLAPPSDGLVVDAATRSQINAAMSRFARALESRDMGTLHQAYPDITVAERNTWSGFFRSAESIRARFTAQDFQVMPDGVDVTAVGKLTFYKRDSRQQTENAVTFRVLLAQARGGGYVMKRIH